MSEYFKQYEQHLGEEGWYVYLRPDDLRCRAIREKGPLNKEEADELIERLSDDSQPPGGDK